MGAENPEVKTLKELPHKNLHQKEGEDDFEAELERLNNQELKGIIKL